MQWFLYSKAIKSGGSVVKTTSSGGGSTVTSSSGGGTTKTTSSGGGSTQTSSSGGDHRHLVFSNPGPPATFGMNDHSFWAAADGGRIGETQVNLNSDGQEIWTYGASGNHTHSVTIPNHTHSVTVPDHTHNVTIPAHTHTVDIPAHTHGIDFGIYIGPKPTSVTVKVDGNTVPGLSLSESNIDITTYLAKDSDGRVKRGTWHEVTITPNDLGRVTANVVTRLFIQSKGGGNY